jgi:hypothetical protein
MVSPAERSAAMRIVTGTFAVLVVVFSALWAAGLIH